MESREAKDFIVEQTLQQAALERVSVSDIERRMMYFTESADAVEDPLELNAEFESQCDASVFEKKMAALMKNTYARIRREDPVAAARWDEAIDTLLAGDHYLLVMWGASATSRISATALAGLGVRFLIPLLAVVLAVWSISKLAGPAVHAGSILLGLFFFAALLLSILQAVRPQAIDWLMRRSILYFFGRRHANKSS